MFESLADSISYPPKESKNKNDMKRELQDYVWSVLPKEFKEEVKYEYNKTETKKIRKECDLGFLNAHEGMFGVHNLTSDAEGEEMLTLPRKAIIQAYKKSCAKRATKYDIGYADCLYNLFGSKCLPYETKNGAKDRAKEPKPAEPKFKVGDKVRIVDDSRHGQKYRGDVTEVVYVDESDPDATYKVDIYDEECGVGLWYSESDLEPYTEPKEREENAQERATLMDDCQSQCKSHHIGDVNDMIDDIIKNSFRERNRLHIAAQIVAALYANYQAAKGFKSMEELVHKALDITDTLIKESEKGGLDGED